MPVPPPPATVTSTTLTHTVVAGETLSSISRQYYGTALRWRDILAANRAEIPEANALRVGTLISIPE
ncbi:MAG: LysM peptidoglycan-binding domain-containing protein [Candidatus Synoicihabitans palmerolidicus]|nr:LysM peptidoglycan-binding domain-containing protein [Candidatus Synoicihabitans palmerolidicus]MCC5022129.1 LysM peptidoglycan-binding domain-containing protein [Candidatus Synoicihabitans palmerolidicus]